MIQKTHVTVAEAVILTHRSKSAIYRLIDTGAVRATDSTDGMLLNTEQLLRAIAEQRRGRPKGSSKHSG